MWILWIKKELILWISESTRSPFSIQEVRRKMIFLWYLQNLHDILRNEKDDLLVLKKIRINNKNKKWYDDFFWLKGNTSVYWSLKCSGFQYFGDGKYCLFWARWNDDICLVSLNFWWHSRTLEMWFFVQSFYSLLLPNLMILLLFRGNCRLYLFLLRAR